MAGGLCSYEGAGKGVWVRASITSVQLAIPARTLVARHIRHPVLTAQRRDICCCRTLQQLLYDLFFGEADLRIVYFFISKNRYMYRVLEYAARYWQASQVPTAGLQLNDHFLPPARVVSASQSAGAMST